MVTAQSSGCVATISAAKSMGCMKPEVGRLGGCHRIYSLLHHSILKSHVRWVVTASSIDKRMGGDAVVVLWCCGARA